jgi:hypothetical protein
MDIHLCKIHGKVENSLEIHFPSDVLCAEVFLCQILHFDKLRLSFSILLVYHISAKRVLEDRRNVRDHCGPDWQLC